MDGLKPCPFCGNKDIQQMLGSGDIECLQCGATMPWTWMDRDIGDERASWNHRAPGWNKFPEQEPEIGEECIVISERGAVLVLAWKEIMPSWWENNAVFYWMPLPEPPEVREE